MVKAEGHILQVCANLDAKGISTVRKHEEELSKYANKPERKVFPVNKSEQDPFERVINQVLVLISYI